MSVTPDPEVDSAGGPSSAAGRPLMGRAIRGFLWSALSFGGSRLIIFAVTLFLARLLAPADFGVVAAGLTLILFLETAMDLGLGAAVIYEQEDGVTDRVRTAYTLNLVIAGCLTLIGVLVAPLVAAFFRTPDATPLFRVLFLYLLLRGGAQVNNAVLQRDLRYRERTTIDIARALTRGLVSVALALDGAGPWSIVVGMLAGEVAALLLSWWYVRLLPVIRWQGPVVRGLLGFGLAALGLKIAGSVLATGDDMIVGNRLGPGELGLYTIGVRLPELAIASIYWIFATVAFPAYAKARLEGADAFRGTMLRVLRLVTIFGFSAGAGLAVVAPVAVPLLFSDRWEDAVPTAVLTSVALGLASIGYASGDIFPALGRPGTLLRLTAVMSLVAVVGFWLGAPHGIAAVAAVNVAFEVVFAVLRLRLANRLIGSTWRQVGTALRPAVLSAVGVVGVALPLTKVLPHDAAGLVGSVLGGLAGGLLVLAVGDRTALRELGGLLRTGWR